MSRINIKWRADVDEPVRAAVRSKRGLRHVRNEWLERDLPQIQVHELPPGIAKKDKEEILKWLKNHGAVEDAEVDGELRGIPLWEPSGSEWHLRAMRVLEAHAAGFRGAGARFAVLDSGYRHAEPYFGGGFVAAEKNFVNALGETQTSTEDNEGHGSACLGLARQVAPEGRAWVGRVMSNNYASWSNVAAGALWAKDFVTAILCSIGGNTDSFTLRDAAAKVREKGVAWICAAGNAGGTTKAYPAATAGNYAIAATDESNNRAGFSNFGDWIAAAAPGVNLATVGGSFSGTSGACPLFGALVASVAAKYGITGLQAVERVLATCRALAAAGLGAGLADAAAALGVTVAEQPPPPPPTPPPPPPSEPPIPSPTGERLTRYASVSIVPSNLSPSNETIAHGVDGNNTTKCLVFQRTATVTYSFSPAVDAGEIELVSANDYPVRDPEHMTVTAVLADGTREVLRSVEVPVFTARFQTVRLLLNQASGPVARLEVFLASSGQTSPGDRGAGILQFAELHPWGTVAATEPVPEPPPPPPMPPEPVVLPAPIPGALADIETTIPTLDSEQRVLLRGELNALILKT